VGWARVKGLIATYLASNGLPGASHRLVGIHRKSQ